MPHPALQPPSKPAGSRLGGEGDAAILAVGGGIGPDEACGAVFMIGAHMHGHQGGTDLGLDPGGAVVVVERQGVVGRARGALHRHPAVAVLAAAAEEQAAVLAEAHDRRGRPPLLSFLAAGRVEVDRAGPGHLVQGDDAGQGAGAVGARPSAAHDAGAFQGLGRQ